MPIFEDLSIASWRVEGQEVFFLTLSIEESGGNRIVVNERPFRDGAKLDDTGKKAREWKVSTLWINTAEELGLGANPSPLYPTMLNKMIGTFDEHFTGDLRLPTIGQVRARAQDYSRSESAELRDAAMVTFTFKEDAEDGAETAFQAPTVKATMVVLTGQTTFSAEKAGAWGEGLESLTEFAAELEGALLAPGRAIDDVTSQVRAFRRNIQRVVRAQESLAETLDSTFNQPGSSELARQLRALSDSSALSADERSADRRRTRSLEITADTDIFAIAALLGQDPEELLDLNAARIDDPFDLREGDTIRVYE